MTRKHSENVVAVESAPYSLRFEPPELARFLSHAELDRRLIAVDFRHDVIASLGDRHHRFDLTLAFRRVAISRRYYSAALGATLDILLHDGSVSNPTPSEIRPVAYTERRLDKATDATTVGVTDVLGVAANISAESAKERERTGTFVGQESVLSTTSIAGRVSWEINGGIADIAVRGHQQGSRDLSATCQWVARVAGRIRLTPNRIRYFGAQGQAFNAVKSLRLRYTIWRNKAHRADHAGFDSEFYEHSNVG